MATETGRGGQSQSVRPALGCAVGGAADSLAKVEALGVEMFGAGEGIRTDKPGLQTQITYMAGHDDASRSADRTRRARAVLVLRKELDALAARVNQVLGPEKVPIRSVALNHWFVADAGTAVSSPRTMAILPNCRQYLPSARGRTPRSPASPGSLFVATVRARDNGRCGQRAARDDRAHRAKRTCSAGTSRHPHGRATVRETRYSGVGAGQRAGDDSAH